MTPERAREILAAAKAAPGWPWVDRIDAQLVPGEDAEIRRVWATLPGHTHYVGALEHIANGETA